MRPLLVALLFLAACAADAPDPSPDPGPDAAAGEVCGEMPGGCDFEGPDCPSLTEVCGDACNASASCCTCNAETFEWDQLIYDCLCPAQ